MVQLDLKRPWQSNFNFGHDDLASEFINIKNWWNLHDQGILPWSKLSILGSISMNPISTTASITLSQNHSIVLADSTSAAITITLPTAVTSTGRIYIVKRISAGNKMVRIVPTGSETIDGGTGYSLGWQYHSISLVSDGANWLILF